MHEGTWQGAWDPVTVTDNITVCSSNVENRGHSFAFYPYSLLSTCSSHTDR